MEYTDVASNNIYDLPGIQTKNGILISHVRYLAWYGEKSNSWQERSVFSARLLIDYVDAHPTFKKVTSLLKNFTEALVTGTIDFSTASDITELYWKPRDLTDANNILFHITQYTDYLAQQDDYTHSRINPFRQATNWEQRMNWCAYYHKQANVFLNHLSSHSEAQKAANRKRLIYTPPQLLISNDKAQRFPEDKIEILIHQGFNNSLGETDYRSQAMVMLLNYGGLRKSELFHIFVSDITVDPTKDKAALVRVYHPKYGESPDPKFKNRNEYLRSLTSFKPRTKYRITERLHAGWKNPLLTSTKKYFEVVFNPTEKSGEFLEVWAKYLKYQRVEPSIFHPFAFTNDRGHPDTLKNFQRRHTRAVERIGLDCKKELGTTEHGHRHAYGYRGRKLGLTQEALQKAMHHKSPNSCLVYIKPTNEDIREEMKKLEHEAQK